MRLWGCPARLAGAASPNPSHSLLKAANVSFEEIIPFGHLIALGNYEPLQGMYGITRTGYLRGEMEGVRNIYNKASWHMNIQYMILLFPFPPLLLLWSLITMPRGSLQEQNRTDPRAPIDAHHTVTLECPSQLNFTQRYHNVFPKDEVVIYFVFLLSSSY